MRIGSIVKVLEKLVKGRKPVLLVGAPGVGKTDVVVQVAKKLGYQLIVMHPVVCDPTDLKGLPYHSEGSDKADFLPYGDLYAMLHATEPTIVFLDDLGQAPPSVQAAAMQLLLARKINGHKISDFVTFVAATNRREDKAGVTTILEPVKSRFATIIHVEPKIEDWVNWALSENLPLEVIAFARFRPNVIEGPWAPSMDIINTASPRTVAQAAGIYSDREGLDDAELHETLAGSAGAGFAAEFMGFLKVWQQLPDIQKILKGDTSAPVPTDPAARYAVCTALVAHADDTTAGAIVNYANRMEADGGAEFAVMLITDCSKKSDTFKKTRAYVSWAAKHSHLMIG